MQLKLVSLVLAAAASSTSATPLNPRQSSPKVYLAGDSTMARTNSPHNGWGEYLSKYITLPVVNKAISGRSARSFTNEGRFTEIEKLVVANDIVVIAFGHNDGSSPNSANDNGRSACPGTGSEVCTSGKTGEKVYTYNYYMEQAARKFTAKGAKVVFSSQTTKNPWQNGVWSGNAAPPRFVEYAKNAARNTGVGFVDHYQSVVKAYQRLGSGAVNAFYPVDYTHTSPAGADVVAQAFVQAVARDFNGTTALKGCSHKLPAYNYFHAPPIMSSPPTILITGLNGYIAAHTALRFLKAGYSVRGTVRSLTSPNTRLIQRALSPFFYPNNNKNNKNLLSIIQVPDVTIDGAFDSAVEGVQAIAHLASPVSMTPSSAKEMMDASVKGTASLLNSALLARGLKSIVYMSSISAVYSPKAGSGVGEHLYGEKDWNEEAEEQVRREGDEAPGYVVYQASKSAAEKEFWAFGERERERLKGVGMSALCPAPTLGPPLYLPEPISSLSMRAKDVYDILNGGEAPPFNTIRGTFVDVRDVAELVFRAVERDLTGEGGGIRERYVVIGGQRASPRRIVRILKQGLPDKATERMRSVVGEPVPESEFARFDVSKTRDLLGREWIGFDESVLDTARVFLDDDKAAN
ncbi:SGNH hydrolase-type esterase domain-containing protein [Cladorrhinum sp. PSN332]|nr:SGNH hydrolase-type esterase domain-containing protein [Cladorrhinum sp. PSN332]